MSEVKTFSGRKIGNEHVEISNKVTGDIENNENTFKLVWVKSRNLEECLIISLSKWFFYKFWRINISTTNKVNALFESPL